MSVNRFGGGDGFQGSAIGNPHHSDRAKVTGEVGAQLQSGTCVSENDAFTGCHSWKMSSGGLVERLRPNADLNAHLTTHPLAWGRFAVQANLGTTRSLFRLKGTGDRLALSGSGNTGNLNLYDGSWNLLVTGPAYDITPLGTFHVAGIEFNSDTNEVRIWWDQTNAGWQSYTNSSWDVRKDIDYRAAVQTASGKGDFEIYLDDFVTLDVAGSHNNQWPSTYPRVIELIPDGAGCIPVTLPTPAFDDGTYVFYDMNALTDPSCCTFIQCQPDISAAVINGVIVHAGFAEEFNTGLVGDYAIRDKVTGTKWDGPAMFGSFGYDVGTHKPTWVLDEHPDGSAWTAAKLADLQFGFKSSLPISEREHLRAIIMYGGVGMDAAAPPAAGRRRLAQVI